MVLPAQQLASRLKAARLAAGLAEDDVERNLILGPGWLQLIESGVEPLNIDLLLVLCEQYDISAADLFRDLEAPPGSGTVARALYAEPTPSGLLLHFPYGKHDAVFELPGASVDEFDMVISVLREGLTAEDEASRDATRAAMSGAVADAYRAALETWPDVNPSDLWYFVVLRAFLDPYNHPASNARLDFGQSWKRTGGWALEQTLVEHYGPFLAGHGIELSILSRGDRLRRLPPRYRTRRALEKLDVALFARGGEFVGAVHVKASFAERRTDDVPLSQELISDGYLSILWTLDCKATPSERPLNRGELGRPKAAGADRRSAKRTDIEDEGVFSACFSYNARTAPTPEAQSAVARIYVCDFVNPDDAFTQYLRDNI